MVTTQLMALDFQFLKQQLIALKRLFQTLVCSFQIYYSTLTPQEQPLTSQLNSRQSMIQQVKR